PHVRGDPRITHGMARRGTDPRVRNCARSHYEQWSEMRVEAPPENITATPVATLRVPDSEVAAYRGLNWTQPTAERRAQPLDALRRSSAFHPRQVDSAGVIPRGRRAGDRSR